MRKLATTLVVLTLVLSVFGLTMAPASATVGGEEEDRYVKYVAEKSGDYTTTMNLTLPTEIPETHTLKGTLEHNISAGASITTTENWVNLTFENKTGEVWNFTSGPVTLDANETVDFTIDTDLAIGNYSVSVAFENDDGLKVNEHSSADGSGGDALNIKVISDTVWTIRGIMMPIAIMIAIVMIALALIKGVAKIFSDVGDSM